MLAVKEHPVTYDEPGPTRNFEHRLPSSLAYIMVRS